MSGIHAMPSDFGIRFIIYSIPVFILCLFIIRLSQHKELWQEVIDTVDMSPIIVLNLAYGLLVVTIVLIAVGITVIILRDRKS